MYKMIKSEKFHSMNATVETVLFNDAMMVLRLVSYESVVCDIDMLHDRIYLYPRHQYSSSTVRQLTRFLNEYMPLTNDTWCIGTIRHLQEVADSNGHAVLGKYAVSFLVRVLGTNTRW